MKVFNWLALGIVVLATSVLSLPVHFRNPLHVFQLVAKELYPNDPTQQKQAVVTLKYLFRNERWNERENWKPIDDFIRTGGLNTDPRSRDQVLLVDAVHHLHAATMYQHPTYLRPSLDILIARHSKQAKKTFGFGDDLLVEPPNLGGRQARTPVSPLFASAPKPMTLEEAESMVGDSWKAGEASSSQKRVKGLNPIVDPRRG